MSQPSCSRVDFNSDDIFRRTQHPGKRNGPAQLPAKVSKKEKRSVSRSSDQVGSNLEWPLLELVLDENVGGAREERISVPVGAEWRARLVIDEAFRKWAWPTQGGVESHNSRRNPGKPARRDLVGRPFLASLNHLLDKQHSVLEMAQG
jgi:hypothetical protein